MKYCAIASGSNGNSYFVGTDQVGILIDVGINSKHMHLRMERLGISPADIDAIFITHEHSDHICGLSVFAKKHEIPVYMTEGTYHASRLLLPTQLVNFVPANGRTKIGTLEVIGVPKFHDAREPCSFVVSDGNINVGVLTDIGQACENVARAIQTVDVLLLESNYDEEMLNNGRYSHYLKNRIKGGLGHISNRLALELFAQHRSPRLKHLILGHLSGENNKVELVRQTFETACKDVRLSIATRYEETELFLFEESA